VKVYSGRFCGLVEKVGHCECRAFILNVKHYQTFFNNYSHFGNFVFLLPVFMFD